MEQSEPYAEAFGAFMHAWLGRALRYCAVLSRDKEVAEEVTQRVFVKLFRTRATPWEVTHPAAYLYKALRNGMADYRKTEMQQHASKGVADYLVGPGTPDAESAQAVAAALLALSDDHREALSLRYFESMSLHEVAEVMGRSVGAVNKLIARGKIELRQVLLSAGQFDEFGAQGGRP